MKNYNLIRVVAVIMLFITSYSFGQNTQRITGVVVDIANNEILPGVQITITKEESIIKELFADEEGFFATQLGNGQYELIVEEFGYEKNIQKIQIENNPLDLGRIQLNKIVKGNKEKNIEAVTVIGRKTTIINQIDRKVVTVGDDLASASQDLSQVMNTIPGVYVDQNSQINLRGNSNVNILINGKPTTFSFEDIMKQYPPSEIDKIEVLTNPPAKYSPEGKSGVINIILKKGIRNGTNINLNTNYSYGETSKYFTGLDFNQGMGKINIFGNAGYGEYNNENGGTLYRVENDFFEDMRIKGKWLNRYAKLGLDYFLNEKNSLSLYTSLSGNNGNMLSNSYSFYPGDLKKPIEQIIQEENKDTHYQEYDLFYKTEFAKSEHKLEIGANYNKRDRDLFRSSIPQNTQELGDILQENFRGSIDYTNPLSESSELTAGAEIKTNSYIENYLNTTNIPYRFDFQRDIYSAYTEYKKEWGRLGIKAGLRAEYVKTTTSSDYKDAGGVKDKQTQLYPTLHLGYKLGEEKKTELVLNYSRRVDRPWIGLYSPFPSFVVGSTVQLGNDKIKPEYTNSIEAGISRNFGKLYLGGNVFYRNIKDEINQQVIDDPIDNITYLKNENTKGNDQYGAELSINYNPFKWWSINSGLEYYFGKSSGYILQDFYTRDVDYFFFRMNNSINLTKTTTMQIFGYFSSRSRDIQGNYKEQWKIDLSVKQSVMNNNLSFTLRVSDLFNTNYSEWTVFRPNNQIGRWDWESRVISFAVKYNFMSGKKTKNIERKNTENNTKNAENIM